jgi:hypothetical protein
METSKLVKTVIIDFDIVGFHYYPEAPEKVDFLRHPHRHLFRIRVGYNVQDSNREKEIFIQQDLLTEYLHEAYGYPCIFNNMSCEMIAEDLLYFAQVDDAVWVEVYEDGRGGARVEL